MNLFTSMTKRLKWFVAKCRKSAALALTVPGADMQIGKKFSLKTINKMPISLLDLVQIVCRKRIVRHKTRLHDENWL